MATEKNISNVRGPICLNTPDGEKYYFKSGDLAQEFYEQNYGEGYKFNIPVETTSQVEIFKPPLEDLTVIGKYNYNKWKPEPLPADAIANNPSVIGFSQLKQKLGNNIKSKEGLPKKLSFKPKELPVFRLAPSEDEYSMSRFIAKLNETEAAVAAMRLKYYNSTFLGALNGASGSPSINYDVNTKLGRDLINSRFNLARTNIGSIAIPIVAGLAIANPIGTVLSAAGAIAGELAVDNTILAVSNNKYKGWQDFTELKWGWHPFLGFISNPGTLVGGTFGETLKTPAKTFIKKLILKPAQTFNRSALNSTMSKNQVYNSVLLGKLDLLKFINSEDYYNRLLKVGYSEKSAHILQQFLSENIKRLNIKITNNVKSGWKAGSFIELYYPDTGLLVKGTLKFDKNKMVNILDAISKAIHEYSHGSTLGSKLNDPKAPVWEALMSKFISIMPKPIKTDNYLTSELEVRARVFEGILDALNKKLTFKDYVSSTNIAEGFKLLMPYFKKEDLISLMEKTVGLTLPLAVLDLN